MNYNLAYTLSAAIYIYMAIYTLSKDVYDKRNRLFFVIALLFAYWALVNSSMFLITDSEIAANTRKQMVFAWGTIYSFIFHLVFVLSGAFAMIKKRHGRWLFYLAVYLPAAINIGLYYFDPYPAEALLLTSNGWIINDYFVNSFLWNYYFYFYYLGFMVSTVIVLLRWHRWAQKKSEVIQSRLLFWTFVFALLIGSLFEIILPLMGYSIIYGITIYIALVPIFGIWIGIERYSLMNFDPTKLTSEMMTLMSDGMVVIDDQGQVEVMNDGAKLILGYESYDHLVIEQICEASIDAGLSSETMVFRHGNGGSIDVLVSTLPIRNKVEDIYGKVILFQDIRKLKNYQKRLEELNETLEYKVAERTKSLKSSNEDLRSEVRMRQVAEKESRELANYDYLTKLPNQRLFKKALMERLENTSQYFAILFIDIDDFKNINDTMGHSVGDQLIISIAKRLRDYVQDEVSLTRIGGDEFIVLLEDHIDYDIQVQEIIDLFGSHFDVGRYQLNINCSIGGACFPLDGKDYESLIKAADIAMYKAKEEYSVRYRFYDDSMVAGLNEEVVLTNELFRAIEANQFYVEFQPIVSAETGGIVSAEALIRWQHPDKGRISPVVFIPLCEKLGVMDKILTLVLEESLQLLEKIQEKHGESFKVAVNVSANQLNNQGLLQTILKAGKNKDKLIKQLEVEVTESAFIKNTHMAIEVLQSLRQIGIGVAIDDFGVHYASLNYLKQLPVTKLKIDKVFIDGIGSYHKDEGIIAAIITLAKSLGLGLVGEGVEHENQHEFLRQMGCEYIQGYYFYKPMSGDDLLTLVDVFEKEEFKPVNG